jgi:DNA polymerase elongation subunit (family B)
MVRWYLQNSDGNVFAITTKQPIKDYFFATEDQVELLKVHYPKQPFNITKLDMATHRFEKWEHRNDQPYRVTMNRPYVKGKYRREILEEYNELLFEADVSYKDLILKDLGISEWVTIINGMVYPTNAPKEFPPLKQVIIDFETDDRNEIIDSSKQKDFCKWDVARTLSMSAKDVQTGVTTHFRDDDEVKLTKAIKKHLDNYHVIRAWNGRRFDYEHFKRFNVIGVNFNKDKFMLLDDQIIFEMLHRKESWFVSLDQAGVRYLKKPKIKHRWSFHQAFLNHHKELEEYNNRDVELVHELEEKFGFVDIVIKMGYKDNVGVLPQDITYARKSSIQAVMRASMNDDGSRVIWKSKSDIPETRKPQGSTVVDPIAGVNRNVLGIDLLSLYNTIIQTWNISPETIDYQSDEALKDRSYSYNRTGKEGVMPKVLRVFEKDRNYYKNLMQHSTGEDHKVYNAIQQGLKIILLAIYGGMGARGSTASKQKGGKASGAKSFYNFECTADVLAFGREIIDITIAVIESFGYKVVYGDTDSVYFSVGEGDFTLDQIKEIMDKVVKKVNDEAQVLLDKYNIPHDKRYIKMEAQGWYDPFILFDKKKNYFARERWNAENDQLHPLDHWEVYAKGVKMEKVSEPMFIRNFQEKLYTMALKGVNGGYVRDYIKRTREDFMNGLHDHDLVFETKVKEYLSVYDEEDKHTMVTRLAQEQKNLGKFQEKTTMFYVIWSVGVDGKAIAKVEGTPMTIQGRRYVWNNRIKGWIDELLDFVYPQQTSLTDGSLVVGANRKVRKKKIAKEVVENQSLDDFF